MIDERSNHRSSAPVQQFPSLTGLRFLCALAVFLTHAWYVADVFRDSRIRQGVKAVLPLGMVGVSVFFVLSGFVLTWSARPQEPARAFWRRRAAKIYPNHLVVWVVLLVFVAVTGSAVTGGHGSGVPWLPALANLLLLHAWSPDPAYTAGLNIVTWSLAVEAFCYLLFPFLLRQVRRLPERWLWAAAGAAVLTVWLVAVVASLCHGGRTVPDVGVSQYEFWIPYFFPLGRLPEFVLGMLLARLARSGRAVAPGIGWSALALVLALGAGLGTLPFAFLPAAVTVVPVAALILSAAAADRAGRRTWLARPRLVRLGAESFAFYVVHWPVIMIAHWLLGGGRWSTPVAFGATGGFLLLALLVARLMHRHVELPAMGRWSRPRRPALSASVPPQRRASVTTPDRPRS
ncbi:acyltransferase family protein [Kitasatospora viridis]|uniref:Peptidoglycan/LPS O-acetylase OafA/YrhL n=1 Tax=Kitasatospora viridis TaxID=281105 RepID=A0A561T6S1_9ACTN|nr:acyltransferase [Kitasatospora viridis]TWF82816.1 peptidoglycan/LPS O-acetylase OafA/YrhL [Kitasatospora viridis]